VCLAELNGGINATICLFQHGQSGVYLPCVFILEFKPAHLESEGELRATSKGVAIATRVYLHSYLSWFIIAHCRRAWRIVDAREGPRRISETVSDRICIGSDRGRVRLRALLIAVAHCSRGLVCPFLGLQGCIPPRERVKIEGRSNRARNVASMCLLRNAIVAM
jgi:hypothetical protein